VPRLTSAKIDAARAAGAVRPEPVTAR